MTDSGWTQASFSEQLLAIARTASSPAEASPTGNPLQEGFRETAAVVSSFNPTTIQPFGSVERLDGDFTIVLGDSRPVAGASAGAWTLKPEVRARTLLHLAQTGELAAVVEQTEASEDDPLHNVLRGLVRGELDDLDQRSEPELAAALELAKWLGRFVEGLPPADQINRLLGRKRLLSPFYLLADPRHFKGRDSELEKLRNYVGVADPKTTKGSIFRHVREFFGFERRPPLMIFGPGGMGKSALLSHFIIEHAELSEDSRFPFAYLDFDRPSVTAREPLTLLAEVFAQLGTQYPSIKEQCELARSEMLPQLGWCFRDRDDASDYSKTVLESNQTTRLTSSSELERSRFIERLAELFSAVASANQPLLIILDTFEELQYYSRADIPDLLAFLELVQRAVPRLRVVMAGRAREMSVRVDPLPLEPLEPLDAADVLVSYGIETAAARLIAGQLGGNPLTLRLATDVYLRDGLTATDLDDITQRTSFLKRVDQERVQGELYRRLLEHIEDKDVRKIAHPGLVLRRVTPDIIFNVLREPCELDLATPDDARELFERLGQQDTLVGWEGTAIVHRSDVRRIMIKLLQQDRPEQVDAIHLNAVRHYETFDDPVSRAEEIYHRCCLDQDIETIEHRWLPGVDDRLRAAIDEIPERLKPFLASRTGTEILTQRDWRKASDRDWERHASSKARQLISHARFEDALELMSERPREQWSDGSPLFNLSVLALAQLDRLDDAFALGKDGFKRVRAADDSAQAMELLASLGSVARRSGRREAAVEYLSAAADVARLRGDLVRAVDLLLLVLQTDPSIETAREEIARLVGRIEPRRVAAAPVLFSRAANELDAKHPSSAATLRRILASSEARAIARTITSDGVRWTSQRLALLSEVLIKRFSVNDLEQFLHESMSISLRSLSKGGSMSSTVFETVNALLRHGLLDEFVTVLARRFPNERFDPIVADTTDRKT